METKLKSFKELAEAARKTTAYFVQGAILDLTEDIVERMTALDISKSELAEKLNTSPAYVTKLLSGETNFTLETMVKVASAVDSELRIHLQPKGAICQWIDVLDKPPIVKCEGAEFVVFNVVRDRNRIRNITGAANEELALAA